MLGLDWSGLQGGDVRRGPANVGLGVKGADVGVIVIGDAVAEVANMLFLASSNSAIEAIASSNAVVIGGAVEACGGGFVGSRGVSVFASLSASASECPSLPSGLCGI